MADLSGIYKITNQINGRFYIGSAVALQKRWINHASDLNKQKHGNGYLQKSWNKYGGENFKFEVLEHCAKNELIDREQYYLDTLSAREHGYNICSVAGSKLGTKMPAEATEKSRNANRGKIISDETRLKLSIAAKHRPPISEDTRKRQSEAQKGRTFTEEHRRNLRIALRNRAPFSEQARKNMSLGHLGLKNPKSDETRRKMSIIMKARIMPEDERIRRSEFMKNRIVSEETRKKLSEATKKQWAKQKEMNIGGLLCRIC